ncbi:ZP domain-containing protein-like isoform X3 [Poecilia latipinna]|nr:PREDICTED: ZP domain-containing protein-like isoform X3 [Poecilia latipinna]XP_014889076.1 PREDICTED: ZP domain-containing protein-like isoform X3 [Poecilia latipinna]
MTRPSCSSVGLLLLLIGYVAAAEVTVTCTESTMKVEVEKASFFRLKEDDLCLIDSSNAVCRLGEHSNRTHIVAIIPLNDCGTEIEENDDYLIFKNEITIKEDDPKHLITRKHLAEARFYCQYPKRGNVNQIYLAHRENVTVWDKGFGTFTYQFEFYKDDQFNAVYDSNSYPLLFTIGNRIYMQIDASSSIKNTQIFVESCRAAPYDNPNYRPTYTIIEDGCLKDTTVQKHPTANNKQFKFSMEAFKFIGLHDQVYISCTVMMCKSGNRNSRCSKGCVESPKHKARRNREAVIESGKHFVSQGPLRLKREADPAGGSEFDMNPSLVFVAGCLLVAVGMICGVIIYKTKTSRVKYQPLLPYES